MHTQLRTRSLRLGQACLKPFRAPPDVWAQRSPWIVLALFALAGAAALDDYGVSVDTPVDRNVALRTLDYVQGRDNDLFSHRDRTYGVAFQVPLVWTERLLGLQDSRSIYLMRHLLTHALFLASGLGCYALAFRLYGSRGLAACAMGLYLLHPRIYAASFPNSKDVPFLSLFMLALWLLHWTLRRGSLQAWLLCGVGVGALANVRIMGLMLVGAALALQACEWRRATVRARRRLAWTSGAFVAASLLTFYALFPYLWRDPIPRLAEVIRFASELSGDPWPLLFQGRVVDRHDLPPSYVPVWMAIAMPPFVLGLGLIGAGALFFARGGGSMSLRFQFGLLACFVAPALAAVLLRSPLFNGWRHLYFLYAPFALLAAGGLGALARVARRAGTGPKAACGFVGAGLLSLLAPTVGIHPYQDAYFNFLVDRTTPGHLQTQYFTNTRRTASWQAVQYLLAHYPDKHLYLDVTGGSPDLQRGLLPTRDRQRIALVRPERADFHISHPGRLTRPSPYAPPILYAKRVYGLAVFSVEALNPDRAGPAAGAFYRAALRVRETREPLIRDRFDIYLGDDRRLFWIQDPCHRFDGHARFVLRVFPVDNLALPRDRRPWGFDNLGFTYSDRGVRVGPACLAVVTLPTYPIRALQVGQWVAVEKRTLWQATVDFPLAPPTAHDYRAAYRALATRIPVHRAAFDVYAAPSGITLAKAPCTPADMGSRFIVHAVPFDPRRAAGPGFDNLDFSLRARGRHSVRFDDTCLAFVRLPGYPIRQVTMAQRPAGANAALWQTVVTQPFAQAAVQAYRAAYAELTAGAPALGAAFDVYVTAEAVAYAKAPCTEADTAPKFILHVVPVRARDLPPDRQDVGFENRDFAFAWQGAHFEGRCLARAALPRYPIARLRVGQFRAGEAPLWMSEIALDGPSALRTSQTS